MIKTNWSTSFFASLLILSMFSFAPFQMAFEINNESIGKKGLKVPNELMLLAVNIDKRVF